jgi:hypothetical protein
MPYIDPYSRGKYDFLLDQMKVIETKGDLEYCIFKLMQAYMGTRCQKYSDLHDCAYAAQHCCDEFRRRFLDKREDLAMKLNGDIL